MKKNLNYCFQTEIIEKKLIKIMFIELNMVVISTLLKKNNWLYYLYK